MYWDSLGNNISRFFVLALRVISSSIIESLSPPDQRGRITTNFVIILFYVLVVLVSCIFLLCCSYVGRTRRKCHHQSIQQLFQHQSQIGAHHCRVIGGRFGVESRGHAPELVREVVVKEVVPVTGCQIPHQ
jgi:hypothetical protein